MIDCKQVSVICNQVTVNGDRIMTGDDVMRWKDENYGSFSQRYTKKVASSFHHPRTEWIKLKQNLQSNLKQLEYILYII